MKHITAISFGAGVQSSALVVMSNLGLHGCPRADVAIFADTQSEPPWVYETFERMRKWSAIPVVKVTAGSLERDVIQRHTEGGRFVALPAFTTSRSGKGKASMLRRQCTREYKIDPIKRELRRRLGLAKGQWAKGRVRATSFIGISVDEIERAAPSRDSWIENRFPLLDAHLRREDCATILQRAGLPVPGKSSCTFCPFHSDQYWSDLRDKYPEEWNRACRFDEAIRDMSMSGVERPVYLHRSLVPLRSAPLKATGGSSIWGTECSGHCGV